MPNELEIAEANAHEASFQLRATGVALELMREAHRQRERWGEQTDDANTVHHWVAYATRALGGCIFYVRELDQPVEPGADAVRIRKQMIKVGGLALSCILAMDRRLARFRNTP